MLRSVKLSACIFGYSAAKGHLTAWSYSCAGQNKNFLTVHCWQLLILQQQFSVIDHKFLRNPVSHSFLDSDRDFAQVERNVRKHENVYVTCSD